MVDRLFELNLAGAYGGVIASNTFPVRISLPEDVDNRNWASSCWWWGRLLQEVYFNLAFETRVINWVRLRWWDGDDWSTWKLWSTINIPTNPIPAPGLASLCWALTVNDGTSLHSGRATYHFPGVPHHRLAGSFATPAAAEWLNKMGRDLVVPRQVVNGVNEGLGNLCIRHGGPSSWVDAKSWTFKPVVRDIKKWTPAIDRLFG